MNRITRNIYLYILLASGFASIVFVSCGKRSLNNNIVFTEVPLMSHEKNYITGESWRYIPHAHISAFNPDKPEREAKVLTSKYFSAMSPDISYDGKHMLFTAQLNEKDPWQIYEMDLTNLKSRPVTSSPESCVDPAYLPGGRLVFSKSLTDDSLKSGHSLYTCGLDGSDIKRITFNPHAYFASSILNDGRILTISRQLFPEKEDQLFMVLRPDGTKQELFYKGKKGDRLLSRCSETINGKIVFIESDNSSHGEGKLVSISYNRPLHSRVYLSSDITGDFNWVTSLPTGKLLVSYRKTESEGFGLYEFDPEKKILSQTLHKSNDNDILEAVIVREHSRPRKLPSEVDMGAKTGQLLCQDVNFTDFSLSDNSASALSRKVEIIGLDTSMGVVTVKKDGSFYLKVIADTPFRILTLDEKGNVIHNSCDWIYLRPNERRGCVGCHEDPEQVPDNRQPLAVLKNPVLIPVHLDGVVEKEVDLE